MIPVWLVVAIALGFLGSVVLLPLLDLSEGDLLLMAGGVAGWVAEIAMSLLIASPAIAGICLAIVSLRRRGGWMGWAGLVLNLLIVGQTIVAFLDAIHMTYYPNGGWLIW